VEWLRWINTNTEVRVHWLSGGLEHTTQPKAALMNLKTLASSGADPVMTIFTRPPNNFWTFPKTSLSQRLFFLTIPLKQGFKKMSEKDRFIGTNKQEISWFQYMYISYLKNTLTLKINTCIYYDHGKFLSQWICSFTKKVIILHKFSYG
jgi:hypothetical protein